MKSCAETMLLWPNRHKAAIYTLTWYKTAPTEVQTKLIKLLQIMGFEFIFIVYENFLTFHDSKNFLGYESLLLDQC